MMRHCHVDGFLNLAFGAAIWSLDSLGTFLKRTFTVWFFLRRSIVTDSVGD